MAATEQDGVVSTQMDARFLYDSAEHSDLTIVFSGISIHAHSLILKTASHYFAELLDGPFRESKQDTIELYDDDPEALTSVLKWMYGFTYVPAQPKGSPLISQLEVFTVADKYGIQDLTARIRPVFKIAFRQATIDQFFDFILHASATDVPEQLRILIAFWQEQHAWKLFEVDAFRMLCRDDPELAAKLFAGDPFNIGSWYRQELSGHAVLQQDFEKMAVWKSNDWLVNLMQGLSFKVSSEGHTRFDWVYKLVETEEGRAAFRGNTQICIEALISLLD